jgi:indolepyruvate ferredoxin oxidoreductase
VVNSHEIITGEFTRDTEFRIPVRRRLELALQARLKDRCALRRVRTGARD